MNLVYFIIHKFYPNLIMDEDIIQCGMLGLCKAVQTWDESKSKFSNYAGCCIGYDIKNELKRRKRQINTISLEHPVKDNAMELEPLGNLIAGDSDVDYVNIQPFYETLKPREKEVFELLYKGVPIKGISDSLGISKNTVNTYKRRLQLLWRNYYGE